MAVTTRMLLLLVCVVFSLFRSKDAVTTGGQEFLVTFQENEIYLNNSPQPQCITLTTFLNTNVSVNVTSLDPNNNFNTNIDISNSSGGYICVDNSIQLSGTNVSRKVIRVTSNENINVIVHDIEEHSADSFQAMPVEEYGSEYYVMSYGGKSQFSVTASDHNTTINIEFPQYTNKSLTFEVHYDGITFNNPTDMNLLLQKYEVFHVHVMEDLTGIYVSSTKPVAVVSGNSKISVGPSGSRDHMAQQMPPVVTWGNRFITVPSPRKTNHDLYRILTSGPDTNVHVENDSYRLEREGDWFQVELSPVLPVAISSDVPVLVLKYVTGATKKIDPCMMLVVPEKQWHNEYSFMFPKLSTKGYLLVIIQTSYKTSLLLNALQPNDMQWMEVENTNVSVGYLLLDNGYYTLRSQDTDVVFAAYMHQNSRPVAFCSTLGMRREKINLNWNHREKSVEKCKSATSFTTATLPSATLETSITTATTPPSMNIYPSTTLKNVDETALDLHTTSVTSMLHSESVISISTFDTSVFTTPYGDTMETRAVSSSFDENTALSATAKDSIVATERTKIITSNENCSCQDGGFHINTNISGEDIQTLIDRLKSHLRVLPNQTSRAIRMKKSVPDHRPSATVFGVTGVALILVCIGITCLNDLLRVLCQLVHDQSRHRKI